MLVSSIKHQFYSIVNPCDYNKHGPKRIIREIDDAIFSPDFLDGSMKDAFIKKYEITNFNTRQSQGNAG